MGKRISRRLLKEDEILTGVERAYLFLAARPREIGVTAAIAVAVVATVVVAIGYRQRRANAASRLLSKAVEIYRAPVLGEPPEPSARKEGKTYPSIADKLREALAEFEKIRDGYWSTPSGKVAAYYAALCHTGLGDSEKAAQVLQPLLEDRQRLMAGMSRLTLASLARDRHEPEKAATLLGDARYAYPPDVAMFFHALALEDQGKRAAAIEAYKSLQKKYPESPWNLDARERVTILESERGEEGVATAITEDKAS